IGLAPDSGTTWLLPHLASNSVALEMALTNRRMAADEALQRGLCAEVTPDDEVVAKAVEYAARLADLSTDALVTTRRLIRGAATVSFPDALEAEKKEQGRLGK